MVNPLATLGGHCGRQEVVDVEWPRGAEPGWGGPILGPTLATAIPGELDPVAVRIIDEDCLQHVEVWPPC